MRLLGRLCRSREFRLKLEKSRDRLYRLAYSWCHAPELADDLTQEALSKALKQSAQLRDLDAMDSWLSRILSNCWHDHLRSRRDTLLFDEERHLHQVTPELLNLRQQDIERVREAVAALPDGQRQVITLVDIEGCRYAEVAEILELPIGTVMSRLCRARSTLKAQLLSQVPAPRRQVLPFRRLK
jgi:RNA polymerase sigma-70 factor (ECF subfamily)